MSVAYNPTDGVKKFTGWNVETSVVYVTFFACSELLTGKLLSVPSEFTVYPSDPNSSRVNCTAVAQCAGSVTSRWM